MTEPAAPTDLREELASLTASARALLEQYAESGAIGLACDPSIASAFLSGAPLPAPRDLGAPPAAPAEPQRFTPPEPQRLTPETPRFTPPEAQRFTPPDAPRFTPPDAQRFTPPDAPRFTPPDAPRFVAPDQATPRSAPATRAERTPLPNEAPAAPDDMPRKRAPQTTPHEAARPHEAAPAPTSRPQEAAHAPPAAQPLGPEGDDRRMRLALLNEEHVRGCTKCVLCETRTKTVFARGNPFAEVMFVGEGPGADEDAQGEPFVGAAGRLLDKMIAAMGYDRDDVYIANIVKCRPPNNRKPEPAEMAACMPYLTEQLTLVKPKVIVALGATAVTGLIGTTEGITRIRGKWKLYKGVTPVMPTFHPAYLLRDPSKKRDAWSDLQEVMKHLGKSDPRAKGGA
ncbi:MAG: uracil-DNA glycosylase family protein [Polyangiaceae bacterium]